MRSFNRRVAATVVAIALILWGSGGLVATGPEQWLAYAAIAVAMVLAYYALTGRGLPSGRDDKD